MEEKVPRCMDLTDDLVRPHVLSRCGPSDMGSPTMKLQSLSPRQKVPEYEEWFDWADPAATAASAILGTFPSLSVARQLPWGKLG